MRFEPGETYQNYIDGQWHRSGAEQLHEVRFPFDGSVVARVPETPHSEVQYALDAAQRALPDMAALSLYERAQILERAAERLEDRLEEFAELMTYETGRPIKELRGDAARSASILRQSADATRDLHGELIPTGAVPREQGRITFTLREPLGVVGAITGFNFPLVLAVHKLGPALGGGNTVVLKPATQTPVSALLMAEIFHEVGLPAGALNVVTGRGSTVGEQIVTDDRVKYVSFTGSAQVGKRISTLAGYKRIGLELGSNSPNIVHKDARIEDAVPRLIEGGFGASGQSCISVQRIYVHRDISREFTSRFVEAVRRLKVGDPRKEDTDVSVLIDAGATDRTLSWIRAAVDAGARVLAGGEVRDGVVLPTVLADVTPDMEVVCREVFAPVVTLTEYDTIDEAIDMANDSVYGLQTGLFTTNLNTAFYAARRLVTGGVQINEVSDFRLDQQPYGGVKDSGIGYEGARYLIKELTALKTVSIRP